MNTKKTLLHIEVIRIIAAFFVIFNHTETKGYFLFSLYDRNSIQYWLYLFISILCKISVPLFFMISGALMLKKDMDIKTIWKKKIPQFLLVLIIFSFFEYTYMLFCTKQFEAGFLIKFLIELYKGNIAFHYWYLYAYLSFLICLPFLRSIVLSLKEEQYKYLIGISFAFTSILPCVEYLLFKGEVGLTGDLRPNWLLTNIVLYPLIGYYLENIVDVKKYNIKFIGLSWIVSIGGGIDILLYDIL